MRLIDRYIIRLFMTNFVLLFVLLFVFAASIDIILNLDRFMNASRDTTGDDAGTIEMAVSLVLIMVDFQGPRLFQFYAYLHGLIAIGAMGFTLSHLYRRKELVAILASGVSLHRVAMPFIGAVFMLGLLQLLNQELVLPRVAPLLLRDHAAIGRESVDDFPVPLMRGADGTLIHSPAFDPAANALAWFTVLERDDRGRTVRRITADRADWDDERAGWILIDGHALTLGMPDADGGPGVASTHESIEFYPSDLSPEVITVRHYGTFAAMLSLRQISRMLRTPGMMDESTLLRHRYARFSSVLLNVLVIIITLPSFLLREPANLLIQTIRCAALGMSAMIGMAIFMMVELPGIGPAVGVFLPVIVLIPVALARVTYIRT